MWVSKALAMDSLLGGKARSPVGFSVPPIFHMELVVESKGLWRRVSRRGSKHGAQTNLHQPDARAEPSRSWRRNYLDTGGLGPLGVRRSRPRNFDPTRDGHGTLQSRELGSLFNPRMVGYGRPNSMMSRGFDCCGETEAPGLSPESFLLRPHADGLVDLFRAETLHLGCEDHIEKRRRLYRDHYQRARAILRAIDAAMQGGRGQLRSYALSSDHQRSFTDVTTTRDALIRRST